MVNEIVIQHMKNDVITINKQIDKVVNKIFSSSDELMSYLRFISRFEGLPWYNQVFLYYYRPDATDIGCIGAWHDGMYVSEFGKSEYREKRKIKENAEPIPLLANILVRSNETYQIHQYIVPMYDITDTEAESEKSKYCKILNTFSIPDFTNKRKIKTCRVSKDEMAELIKIEELQPGRKRNLNIRFIPDKSFPEPKFVNPILYISENINRETENEEFIKALIDYIVYETDIILLNEFSIMTVPFAVEMIFRYHFSNLETPNDDYIKNLFSKLNRELDTLNKKRLFLADLQRTYFLISQVLMGHYLNYNEVSYINSLGILYNDRAGSEDEIMKSLGWLQSMKDAIPNNADTFWGREVQLEIQHLYLKIQNMFASKSDEICLFMKKILNRELYYNPPFYFPIYKSDCEYKFNDESEHLLSEFY